MTRVYPGSATLEETQRACKFDQDRKSASLKSLKPALLRKDGSPDTKVNVAEFKEESLMDVPKILNVLKFIDMTPPTAAADAAAAMADHKFLFDCKIFVGDQEKSVKVFAKKAV